MTNPGNAVGTNAAYGGRTSVNAFNDILSAFSGPGILSGWRVSPKTGMTIQLGGDGVNKDVAVAEDDVGNRTSINNISGQPIDLAIAEAPSLGQRIDKIVAYVNNPPEGTTTVVDNPGACGLIKVEGEVAANNPTAPTESDIRTAIGADGGSSSTSYYVVLATILVTEGMTDITATNITQGENVGVGTIDSVLDPTSENPVQNKVITEELQKIEQEINGANATLTRVDSGAGVTIEESV